MRLPIDQRDLQSRIAAATPQDTVRGLIFNALFDAVEEHAGKPAALACDASGKGHRTEFFSYPVAEFLATIGRAVEVLEPRLGSADRAFFECGYRALANVFASTLGATILALSRKDPRALLGQAPTAYRGTVSYGERKLEWLGPTQARLSFVRDFLVPPYHCGVFTAALDAVGAKGARVGGRQVSLLEATYEVGWDG
jgi:uncharacterized protein (TIGR02265 family)